MNQPPTVERRIRFQDLGRWAVRRILLVSSLYDSFILAEDGQLRETFLSQFVALNLNTTPDLVRASTAADAMELLTGPDSFDLIITTLQVGEENAVDLAQQVRSAGLNIPVIVLAYENRELTHFRETHDCSAIERFFLWQGDVRILLAIVKYIEDRRNVRQDTGGAGVPAILVVEDSVRFYSAFLPMIYTELVKHTHGLITEGRNLYQKMIRTRARPKVLLCETYEEAWNYFSEYEEHILGVISDIEFPRRGKLMPEAGVALAKQIREHRPDLPILLQSSQPKNERLAASINARFGLKQSPTLLHEVRSFMLQNFGFGDFAFQMPDGTEVDRASNLHELVEKLHTVPAESIAFHGSRNHFSIWLKARGEYSLAHGLRLGRVADYATLEDLRQDLIASLHAYQQERDLQVVADFDRRRFDGNTRLARIGGGSLGGKGRSLAFVNRLFRNHRIPERYPDCQINVPEAVVLGTDVFDQFLESNDLEEAALHSTSDAETAARFLTAEFSSDVLEDLTAFLRQVRYPLAVRSSGQLEDARSQPLAGLYHTYMLSNNHRDDNLRLQFLVQAIKRIYASMFSSQARYFFKNTAYRLEEEKMAVIIQRLVGTQYDKRFYPHVAGVARSRNYYPIPPLRAEDGIVAAALGLGRTVVDGEPCVRFCPRHPQLAASFSSVDQRLENSQRQFLALDLSNSSRDPNTQAVLQRLDLQVAEKDGSLASVGSTYLHENHAIVDGTVRPGFRLVSLAPILKQGVFPLAEILCDVLQVTGEATASPVELEFAVDLSTTDGKKPEFALLQMRPLSVADSAVDVEIHTSQEDRVLCRSDAVLGHGVIDGVRDIVVVDSRTFERQRSVEVAQLIGRWNALLQEQQRPYLLIGVGRWGSADPYLGIPVSWSQIAGARVIVESGFRDFVVEPSQGSHFFQNLSSLQIGYFTVNARGAQGFIDWEWLGGQERQQEEESVYHIQLSRPLTVKMNGKIGEGVILRSEEAPRRKR